MSKLLTIISCMTLVLLLRIDTVTAADQVFFYYTDPVGTPVAMSDEAGNVVWESDYMPFGEDLPVTTTVPNNKMFVGKEKDAESGMHYFGARYMEATIGRFISPDPKGPIDPGSGELNNEFLLNSQKFNAYLYGLNNPYLYLDPDGNSEIRIEIARMLYTNKSTIGNIKIGVSKSLTFSGSPPYRFDTQSMGITLEKPFKANMPFTSSIPGGKYSGILYNSPKYGPTIKIIVEGRDDVIFHIGNFPRNTEGCVLLGMCMAAGGDAIKGRTSKPAFKRFQKLIYGVKNFDEIAGEETNITVEVKDSPIRQSLIR